MKHISLIGLLLASMTVSVNAACRIARDEEVTLFPAIASWDPLKKQWETELHGWLYEPETDSIKRGILISMLRNKLGLSKNDTANQVFERRAHAFLVDNESNRALEIRLGSALYVMPRTDPGGHFQQKIKIASLPADQWSAASTSCAMDGRLFSTQVWAAGPQGLLVISDIDDTIKVSDVRDHHALLVNSFLKEFQAVPGMGALYSRWAQERPGTVFYYLSASPWQFFSEMTAFLKANQFPEGILSLKRFRWKDSSFYNLFQSPAAYKLPLIEEVMRKFPERKFILVGDTGEKDPEIYAVIARKFSSQVEHIYLRNAYGQEPARLAKAFEGVPATLWTTFGDPGELP